MWPNIIDNLDKTLLDYIFLLNVSKWSVSDDRRASKSSLAEYDSELGSILDCPPTLGNSQTILISVRALMTIALALANIRESEKKF